MLLADQCAGIAVEQRPAEGGADVFVAARQGAAVAVVQTCSGQAQALEAGQQTTLVDDVAGAQGQHAVADQLAGAVVQVAGIQVQALAAGNFAVLVVQVSQVLEAENTGGGDQAGAVVEVAGGGAEVDGNSAAQQRALLVVQAAGVDVQGIGGADQPVTLVVQLAAEGQVEVGAAGQGAAVVVEARGLDVQRSGCNQALEVGQGVVDAQGQGLVAQQLAVVVVQALRGQGERLGAGDLAAVVVDAFEVLEDQQRCVDQAALVVQLALVEVQGQGRIAEELTALLVQIGDAGDQCAVAGDAAAVLVGQFLRGQVEAGTAAQAAGLAVVERAGLDQHALLAADGAVIAIVEAGAFDREAGVGDDFAALVEQGIVELESQGAGTGDAAQGVGEAGRRQRQRTFGTQYALGAIQVAGQVDGKVFLAQHRTAAVIQRLARQAQASLARQLTLGAVEDVLHRQGQCAAGEHLAAVTVVQGIADQGYVCLTREFTTTVIDRIDLQGQRVGGADQPSVAVVQRSAGKGQAAEGDHLAALVVDAGDIGRNGGFAGNLAGRVVQARGLDVQITVGDHGSVAIEQLPVHAQDQRATTADQTTGAVQAGAVAVEGLRGNQPFDAVEHLIDAQGQGLVADEFAVTVVQVLRGQGERLGTGDFAAPVVDVLEVFQHQDRRGDHALEVVQLAVIQVQVQGGLAEQLTALLIETADAGGQCLVTGNTTGSAVADLAGGQVKGVTADQIPALGVVESAGGDAGRAFGAEQAVLLVVQALAGNGQAGIGGDGTTLVDQGADGGECQRADTGETAVGVVEAAGIGRQCAFAADQAGDVGQGVVETNIQALAGDEAAAAVVQALSGDGAGAGAEQEALGLVDDRGDFQAQVGTGQDLAVVAVVQALAVDVDPERAGNLPAAVVHGIDVEFQRFCRAYQAAVAVIQALAADGQQTLGNQLAALVGQLVDVCSEVGLAGDAPAAVIDASGFQAHRAAGAEQAADVIQLRAIHPEPRLAAEQALLTVVELGDCQLHVLGGTDFAGAVVQGIAAQGQAVVAGQAADPVVQASGLHINDTFGAEAALAVIEQTTDACRQATVADQASP
ncbi:hypothetical protein BN844_1420 [Pseudomonas sp. SHC52]|nr:hypothetical protein BN844_1420 [Pseudomonas sp. SHC52]